MDKENFSKEEVEYIMRVYYAGLKILRTSNQNEKNRTDFENGLKLYGKLLELLDNNIQKN